MDIKIDSRKIKSGDIFFCLEKEIEKAQKFIHNAIKNGAKEVYTEHNISAENVIQTENIWQKLGEKLRTVYNQKPTKILAITGTDGKTSTAWFVAQMLQKLGQKSVYIGTIGVSIGNLKLDNEIFAEFLTENLTTPDIASLHKILHIAKTKADCDFAILEASSHGIHQKRLDFLDISVAGFTNFSQDHLDYHKTIDEYFDAKSKLFSDFLNKDGFAIINNDDEKAQKLIEVSSGKNIITYGKNADLAIEFIEIEGDMQSVNIEYKNQKYHFFTAIIGNFQIYNITCAIGFCFALGFKIPEIIDIISQISPPPGRLQRVKFKNKYTNIYIDYAHTPNALQKALSELKKVTQGRLICVFGCGGNRDHGKRPKMGQASVGIANFTIVTDDNPRNEEPAEIRKEIISGIVNYKQDLMEKLKILPDKNVILYAMQDDDKTGNFLEITSSRADAIEYAIKMMKNDDVLLIAGKGHEDYQIIGNVKSHFSDEECVIDILNNIN